MVDTVVVPNYDDCNEDVGDGSGDIEGGGGDKLVVPHLLPPPPLLVVLVDVVVFNASSLLPAVAPINRGILPPLGSATEIMEEEYLQLCTATPPMLALPAARISNGERRNRCGTMTAAAADGCNPSVVAASGEEDDNVSYNTAQGGP